MMRGLTDSHVSGARAVGSMVTHVVRHSAHKVACRRAHGSEVRVSVQCARPAPREGCKTEVHNPRTGDRVLQCRVRPRVYLGARFWMAGESAGDHQRRRRAFGGVIACCTNGNASGEERCAEGVFGLRLGVEQRLDAARGNVASVGGHRDRRVGSEHGQALRVKDAHPTAAR